MREMFVGEVKNAAACKIIQTLARLSSNQFFDGQTDHKTVYLMRAKCMWRNASIAGRQTRMGGQKGRKSLSLHVFEFI